METGQERMCYEASTTHFERKIGCVPTICFTSGQQACVATILDCVRGCHPVFQRDCELKEYNHSQAGREQNCVWPLSSCSNSRGKDRVAIIDIKQELPIGGTAKGFAKQEWSSIAHALCSGRMSAACAFTSEVNKRLRRERGLAF